MEILIFINSLMSSTVIDFMEETDIGSEKWQSNFELKSYAETRFNTLISFLKKFCYCVGICQEIKILT